ncbi:Abhydrolase domain-containing protein mpaH [Penicillium diatomitis]|uniref:Abhydrolase domain-containing protein mpaH n=1 Tax=Penicillium diatomitis TaxID=2819901 RepID=A0A9W9X2J4_9EURO|nr:Abhydrolase domain-containing protein mpaH [Penicillium diatomitis]KAJ5482669.1 Abhydrolase domain-containing protein mpaH [Penicillium diatomitis]
MSSSPFRIVEHRVPCQHIREYPGATANEQEEPLHLAVKQYIPIDNPNPQPGDVTILGAHANGFPKELYEPLWEEIHARSEASGLRIRSIWMADVAHQGESGVINEDSLGNDPSWFDHPRDFLHLINVKRAEMPRPIVAYENGFPRANIGDNSAQLSLMHPRLLHTLVLLDPVIQRQTTQLDAEGMAEQVRRIAKTTQLSTYRRDMWPSRKAAAEGFKRSPFYQAWDPRVLDRWIKYGLRDLPTAVHPLDPNAVVDKQNPPVTLRTTLHQEVFTFSRPNYANRPGSGKPVNRVTHPDLDAEHPDTYPFYRPEPARIFSQLPYLRPSVLYIFGGKSDMCHPEMMADKLANTGTAIGGSGGVAKGRVRDVLLEDYGHLLAQEAVNECAEAAVSWLTPELRRWRDEEESFRSVWSRKSKVEKLTVDKQWYEHVPAPARRPNNGEKKSGESKL